MTAAAPASMLAEGFKPEPWWWEAAPPVERSAPLPDETDVLVVGGGYTGLNCALELARSGASALVCEAGRFGEGASSRNGGMVSNGINIGKGGKTAKRYGRERFEAMIEEASEAYDHLKHVLDREGLDASLAETGRFVGAHTPRAYEALARRAEELNRLARAGAHMLPRGEQHREIRSDYYHGGMVLEAGGGVHPALYLKTLLEAAERAGAACRSRCAVERIERRNGTFRVTTADGEVTAREVVVATNGYTGKATPWARRRLVPVSSYIVATEEIGEERIRALFPNLRMIADTKRVLFYFRPSPDRKRILFGGRASFRGVAPQQAAPMLGRSLVQVFPELDGIKLTHGWSGKVAFTFDHLPHLGEAEGMRYGLGCNGSGVVMMSWLGYRLALDILGRANRPSAYSTQAMPAMPGYDGRPWFLPLVGGWYRMRDEIDRRLAGRGEAS